MNNNPILPDDPRLTAYALDEMEPSEQAEFARLLQGDPAGRAAVEEIRAAALMLGSALHEEPAAAPVSALTPAPIPIGRDLYKPAAGPARLLRFPSLYFVISGLAAACFALIFALRAPRETAQDELAATKTAAPMALLDRQDGAGIAANQPVQAFKAAAAPALLSLAPADFMVEDRFFPTAETATSTFPLHVGHESYDTVRALLRRGVRPARSTVHVAEMINAFTYSWPEPLDGEAFASVLEETEAPWAPGHRLVRIGLKWRGGRGYPLANDASVDVNFNPARVQAWRLIGFERERGVAGVRGNSGETIAPGDAVTVLYELVPVVAVTPETDPNLLKLALRYREPTSGELHAFERPLPAGGATFAEASADMKFATAVAAFGLRLRESATQAPATLADIEQWGRAGGTLAERTEFVGLVQAAERIVR